MNAPRTFDSPKAPLALLSRASRGLGVAAALLAACTVTETEAPAPPATTPPATTPATPAACPAKDTTAPTTGPTIHEATAVKGAETWTAEASPHIVKGAVDVDDGGKLTIAPCAVVQLVEGASINVGYPSVPSGGSLVAEGSADAPIRIESKDGARWNNVHVVAPATARLSYVTLEGGGGGGDETGHATLHVLGDGDRPRKPIVFVDHVTIEGSRGAGVKVHGGAAFAPGSKALTITRSGANNAFHPYPLEVGEQAIDGIPTGTYKGNGRDEIYIEPEVIGGGGGIQEDTTMHDRGVPYHVYEDRFGNLHVGDGTHDAVLTIEAGVKLLFPKETVLQVEGHATGASAIRALGTASAPVVFTSAEPTPAPGDWRGLYFNGAISAKNALEHVRIEYTGGDCACSLVSCSAGVSEHEAAIIFGEEPKTMFLKDSVIAHGAGHGVLQGYTGLELDWKDTNTFEDLAGCPVTLPRNPDTSCPDPMPACK